MTEGSQWGDSCLEEAGDPPKAEGAGGRGSTSIRLENLG